MTAEEFVAALDAENRTLLERLAPDDTLAPEVEGDLTVVNLLKVALKNEVEATEIAARWLVTTTDVDVKLALARQCGDEAKHYRLVADRLREMGFDARAFDPLAKGFGPLFLYLDSLKTTVERVAAGQFTREAIAVVKNRQFIEFCERAGDATTARLYRDVIEPDEHYHHELGRTLLLRLASTADAQDAARRAARRTLEMADELQTAAGKGLRDVIGPRLKVLFCGINPGLYSAATGFHFARPGNRFWPALHASGFTPRLLSPHEERELLVDELRHTGRRLPRLGRHVEAEHPIEPATALKDNDILCDLQVVHEPLV